MQDKAKNRWPMIILRESFSEILCNPIMRSAIVSEVMLYKAFVQFCTMTTSMITQKTDMGPNKNYMSKAAIRGIILEIQQEHILKRNRREVEICEAEEQLPKIAANKCMGNAIGAMATPERAACTTIAKARAGAPVIANSPNMRKDNSITKLL